MKLLIDSDAIAFIAAASADGRVYTCPDGAEFKYKRDAKEHCEVNDMDVSGLVLEYRPEPAENACHNAKTLLQRILDKSGAAKRDCLVGIKTNKDNFRYKICKEYKANRKDMHRPFHIPTVLDYLRNNWYTVDIKEDIEVDDWLGIEQTRTHTHYPEQEVCIVTHDKDLDMIPGWHYRIKRDGDDQIYYVDDQEALRFFYKQVLIGDTSDNIFGVKGIGPAKADKIITVGGDEEAWRSAIVQEYLRVASATPNLSFEETQRVPDVVVELIRKNSSLLWIQRYGWKEWDNGPEGSG